MAEHSPLPWVAEAPGNHVNAHCGILCDAGEGVYVADVYADCEELSSVVAEANAQLICRAVNHHDELVAALKRLRIDANRLCDRMLGGSYEDDCRRSIAIADAVLTKVKDGQ